MRSGATCSAGRAKKDWGRAGRSWMGVVALGVAWERGGGYWKGAGICRDCIGSIKQDACRVLRIVDHPVLCPRRRAVLKQPLTHDPKEA